MKEANWSAIFCLGNVGYLQGAILITCAKPLLLGGECDKHLEDINNNPL